MPDPPANRLSLLQGEALLALRGGPPAEDPDAWMDADQVQRAMRWPVPTPKPSAAVVGRALGAIHAQRPELVERDDSHGGGMARWRARRA